MAGLIALAAADPQIEITPAKTPPAGTTPLTSPVPLPESDSQETRDPIPNPLEQQKALNVIEHVFRDEFANRQSRQGRLELALKLLDQGRITEDDPVGRYVMLAEARSLGTELGEPTIVMDAVDELADTHRISLTLEKLQSLKKLERTVRGFTAQGEISEAALEGMFDCIQRDDFLTARQFQQIAETAARKSQLKDLNTKLKSRIAELTLLQSEFQKIEPALRALQLKPDDPAANLQVGTYYAVFLDDWARGLPMLAKTNDNDLRRLAQLELSSPMDSERQLELADGWWNWGSALPAETLQRKHVLRHSIEWYKRVQPQLKGLSESRVTRMIQDFQSMPERLTFGDQEDADQIVYLTDLTPQKVNVVRNAFGTQGRRNGGEPLKLRRRWYNKALSTPPPTRGASSVVYELPDTTFKFFRATVGIDDEVGNRLRTPLTFEVWGDNQLLWKSEPIPKSGVLQTCRVEILTVKRLELKVNCPGSDEFAWPVWGDPRLMMR